MCIQDGEDGNKTFWNAVKSLGRSISLISKPEAQAAVCARLRNGQISGLNLLLGQGGKSRVAEATAVKVDTSHLHHPNALMIIPSSFKINHTLQLRAKHVFLTYFMYLGCNFYFEPTHRLPHHPPSKFDRPPRIGAGAGPVSSGSGTAGAAGSSIFAFVG